MDTHFAKRKADHQGRGLSFPDRDGKLNSDELRMMDAYERVIKKYDLNILCVAGPSW